MFNGGAQRHFGGLAGSSCLAPTWTWLWRVYDYQV